MFLAGGLKFIDYRRYKSWPWYWTVCSHPTR